MKTLGVDVEWIRDAGNDLVRMGDDAGFFWFELHSNVSNCNAWQISIFLL